MLTDKRLAEIRRGIQAHDANEIGFECKAWDHACELFAEVQRLRTELANDPVRKLIAHPRFRKLETEWPPGASWLAIVSALGTFWGDTPGEACAAALRALEGSDGNG